MYQKRRREGEKIYERSGTRTHANLLKRSQQSDIITQVKLFETLNSNNDSGKPIPHWFGRHNHSAIFPKPGIRFV